MAIVDRPATPWHLWLVGILALLFYGGGCYNYLMIQTANPVYLESLTAEQLDYFTTAPLWFHAVWAVGVWLPLLGALLLLLRSRFAAISLAIGFVAFIAATFHQFSGAAPASMTGGVGIISTVVMGLIQLAFVLYAFRMARRGVLR